MDEIKTYFSVDLNLLIELGRQLISRDEIAVTELVKNSYDAEAKQVEVTVGKDFIKIADNGSGMNADDINYGWLLVGTSVKKRITRTPNLDRRVLGEKGIGRLAVFRLGRSVEVVTRKLDNDPLRLSMTLKKEELPSNNIKNKVGLDQLPITQEKLGEIPIFPDNKTTGTIITVSSLTEEWGMEKTEKLSTLLSKLVSPFGEEIDNFSITFISDGSKTQLSSALKLSTSHYSLDAQVEDSGEYIAKYVCSKQGSEQSKTFSGNFAQQKGIQWKKAKLGGPGSFKFRLNVYDLDDPSAKRLKPDIKNWSGISLIKNKFLVVQPGVDWMEFNIRRVNNPTLRLSTNQVIGAIYIDSDQNPELKDKTDRQGLLENEAFLCLKDAVSHLTGVLEKERAIARKTNRLAKGNIFERLDPAPLRNLASKLQPDYAEEAKKIADDMAQSRSEIEDLLLGRDRMATLGSLASKLVHEGRNALVGITDNYPLIESHISEVPESINKAVNRMYLSGKRLTKLFDELDPFIRFGRRQKELIDIGKIIDGIAELYMPEMKMHRIELKKRIQKDLAFKANATDIYILMANFIVNSIYWIPKSQNAPGVNFVMVTARQENDEVIIEVEDNGPGIGQDERELIFDAGYSTKTPEGTGLGLAIVKDIAESYGGTAALSDNSGSTGAHFIVRLRMEGK